MKNKTFIIAMQGAGATTFIKARLIPEMVKSQRKFRILDFSNEYSGYQGVIQVHKPELTIKQVKENVINAITTCPPDTTLILDAFQAYLAPKRDEDDRLSYKWLYDLIKDRKVILTLHSLRFFDSKNVKDSTEKIYFFKSLDSSITKAEFLNENEEIVEMIERKAEA